MSNTEWALLACVVWFVGIFVAAYLIGRSDAGDDDMMSVTALIWPAVLILLVFWIWLRAIARVFNFLVNAPFKIGVRHRERNRVRVSPHQRNGQ